MFSYVRDRLLLAVLVVFVVSVFVFMMLHLVPGDPVHSMLFAASPTAEQIEEARELLGLNKPLPIQYFMWIQRIFAGDFGRSYSYRQPVLRLISTQLGSTLELAFAAVLISFSIGLVFGTFAAYKRFSWTDTITTALAVGAVSMPNFWLGLLLISFFSFNLNWFPATGQGSFQQLILPALTLGLPFAAVTTRLMRASLLDIISQDYLQVARAKGLTERSVIAKHAVRNALIPNLTIVGTQLGSLIAGTVIVETVFARQGIGQLLVQGILSQDLPLVQGLVLLTSIGVTITNLLVDGSYALLDPRIRYQ